MLNITNQSDYGILFISYLLDKKNYLSLSQLVKETQMPRRFLARIAAKLVKHKLLKSKEGKSGGYQLTKKAYQISLYDYLRIFEGELTLAKCQEKDYQCRWEIMCQHKSFLRKKLSQIISKQLSDYKLIDLFKA